MKLHKKNKNIAVLGKISWAKEFRNDFMNYIEGIQFHYKDIKDKNNVKLHFYTSNISLEKKWFENEKYSSKFKNYGFEDIEIGYRLEKKGLRVIYNPKAIVYHMHKYSFEQFCNRMEKVGRSAIIFTKLHPELKWRYIPPGKSFFRIASFLLSNKITKLISKKSYWYFNFVYKYSLGIKKELMGLREDSFG
jgi:GT2 family glycosyltransferase